MNEPKPIVRITLPSLPRPEGEKVQYLFWKIEPTGRAVLVGGGFYTTDREAIFQGGAYSEHADKTVQRITEADTKRVIYEAPMD